MERNGLLVINKSSGMTSHDVVARARKLLGERSVGHIGTLDPMATGVLVLLLGRFTRLAQFYDGSEKEYDGTIRLGFETDTYDAEGERVEREFTRTANDVSLDEIRGKAAKFLGPILQTPPPFSAKKIAGVPAYKLARKKQEVEIKAVEVNIKALEITSFEGDLVGFRAHVSGGTYIRSIAHDLGRELGTGAHLASLRRTRVAEFEIQEAKTLEEIEAAVASGASVEAMFVHPRRALSFMPAVVATEQSVNYIRNGRAVNLPEMTSAPLVRVFADQRRLVAICQRIAGTLFQPKVVLYGNNEIL